MLVNYDKLNQTLTESEQQTYIDEVLRNPYIPHGNKKEPWKKVDPFYEQMLILMDECDKKYPDYKLISGGAFSGKSQMTAIMAARYLIYPNYRGLILRNTYKQVVSSGGAVDKLRGWLGDKKRLGKYTCKENKTEMFFEAPNGARIYYSYCDTPEQMDKIRGTSYHDIFIEEASEIPGDILEFLPRSIRPHRGKDYIPEGYVLNSNPSFGPGVDWLHKMFLDEDSPHKHYTLDLMMNPFVDRIAYDKRLAEMSPVQQAFMRFGDWNYVPDGGLLLTREQLEEAEIDPLEFDYNDTIFSLIGVDIAGEGDDYTSLTSILYLKNGNVILDDNILLNDSTLEEQVKHFVEEQTEKTKLNRIIFEEEGGGSATYALKHFKHVLSDIQKKNYFSVKMKPVRKNKFERARPLAYGIRNGFVRINKFIPNKQLLQNQFMYVNPDKQIMKKHKSPDFLDSATIGYNSLNSMYNLEEYNRKIRRNNK